MKLSRQLLSPLDCFFSPEKDLNQKYIAFNLFDYTFFSEKGHDVIYERIGIEEAFEEWERIIETKPAKKVNIQGAKVNYELDLKEFFCYRCQGVGYGSLISLWIKKRFRKEVEIKDLVKKAPVKTSLNYKIKKLLTSLSELLSKRLTLIEDHNALYVEKDAATLFNNAIFNIINRKKIQNLTNALWEHNKEYLENNHTHLYQLQKLIQSLLYLDHKSFQKIQISNFTGPSQQAALIYASAHGVDMETVQHGRWMVHHLPSPLYKHFYRNKKLIIWEEEFLKNVNGDLTRLSQRPKPRLALEYLSKENYILIGTSAPMVIDLDIYFQFWQIISTFVNHSNLSFKIKLHKSDVLTIKFLNFFQLNKIEIIPVIQTIPEKIIVLNTTFSYEFAGYTEVFDFKQNTTLDSVKEFLAIE